MKILVITPYCPYPPEKTGGVRTLYNLLRHAGNHNLYVIYYDEYDQAGERALASIVDSVQYLPLKKNSPFLRVASLIARVPFSQYQYDSSPDLDYSNYDIVIFDQYSSLALATENHTQTQIAIPHDNMQLYYGRKKENSSSLVAKFYYFLQESYAKRSDAQTSVFFKKIFFLSEVDVAVARNNHPEYSAKIDSFQLGIEIPSKDRIEGMGLSVVFAGAMDYSPNEDAAIFFLCKVFPELQKLYPDISFFIVGKNPTEALLKAAENKTGVHITGHVESVPPYIKGSTLFVSPLRFGTGIKYKILDAMACGAAIIASDVSVEGIPEITVGDNCLLANTEIEWVEQIDYCIKNPRVIDHLKERSLESIQNSRSWEAAFCQIIGIER